MGQISIILIGGLLFLLSYEPLEKSLELSSTEVILWTLLLTAAPGMLAYIITVYASRELSPSGTENLNKLYRLRRFMIVFECLSLAAYVCNLYVLNLPWFIDKHLAFLPMKTLQQAVAILPLLTGLVFIRLVFYQMSRNPQVRYREILSLQIKFLLLPLIPMFVYFITRDLIYLLPDRAKLFLMEYPYILIGILLFPGIAFAYLFTPLLMQFLWKTIPLTDDVVKQKLARLVKRSGVKFRDIVVWQTGALSIANAAVAGTVPWNRRIFLTDALLRYFTDEQIETIVAHELGHIRYRHIPTYMLFSLIYLLSYLPFYRFVEAPLAAFLGDTPILSTLSALAFFSVYFVLLFRYLSRRCEHQADLYAVTLTENPEAFKTALMNLSMLNSLPKSIKRFFELFNTHPSVARRIDFVNQFEEKSESVQRYKTYLLEVKILIVLLPVFSLLAFMLI